MKKVAALSTTASLGSINEFGQEGPKRVYPSTFGATEHSNKGYKHNFVGLDLKSGKAEAVQIDSVGSFANRIEAYLLSTGLLPAMEISIGARKLSMNELPHRIYDAVMRDSFLNGVPWRDSEIGKKVLKSNIKDATALFKYAPLVLLFGGWDSMGGDAVAGVKIARSVTCEIWGYGVQATTHSAHRINPFPSGSEKGDFALDDNRFRVLESDEDIKQAKKNKTYKKLSECGHGSAFVGDPKGCFVDRIEFTGSISLSRLNRYQFPGDGDLETRNNAGRKVLANLALFGIMGALAHLDLRSGCELYTASRKTQKIYCDGQREDQDVSNIEEELHQSIAEAATVGLDFAKKPVLLEAGKALSKIAGVA